MKKTLISVICLCLALITLVGCTPASSIIKDTTAKDTGIFADPGEDYLTEPKDYVIKSKNYAFYLGEYLFFFGNILNSFGVEALKEYGYDENVPLKEQTVKGHDDVTWFEFIDSITLDKLKRILIACEYAAAEKPSYITEAKSYIENVKTDIKYASDNDPEGYIRETFGNGISYQNYLNAIQMEYIYELYSTDLYKANMEALTDIEVNEHADGSDEKDTTPVRSIISLYAESRGNAEDFVAELGNTVTKESVLSLADVYELTAIEDYIMKDSTIEPEIVEWSFGGERTVGESAVIKLEKEDRFEYCAVFYFGEGEATYLFKARLELAREKTESNISESVESYSDFKFDEKILDGINI